MEASGLHQKRCTLLSHQVGNSWTTMTFKNFSMLEFLLFVRFYLLMLFARSLYIWLVSKGEERKVFASLVGEITLNTTTDH